VSGRLAVAAVVAVIAGCGGALPPEPAGAALYRDLQRIVRVRDTTLGWQIDRLALHDLAGHALDSTCRVEPDARARLLAWIDAEIARRGGPVEEAWRRAGKDLDRVEDLLELTRVRLLLASAVESAPRDCPFWLAPGPRFRGRQLADDRFQLVLEGGGKLIFLRARGDLDLSGGGAGRALVGYAPGRRLQLMTGLELTGSAVFPRDDEGQRSGLVLALDVVVPAVVRWRLVNTYLEAEAGWLGHLDENDPTVVHGLHLGFAYGFKALRQGGWIMPGVAIGVAWERTFPAGARPTVDLFKIGARVTFDVDL
jgi:hypothetical protein